jgi:hypothetical protein
LAEVIAKVGNIAGALFFVALLIRFFFVDENPTRAGKEDTNRPNAKDFAVEY